MIHGKYVLKSTDIMLGSYPRSGNTWLRHLITLVRYPGKNIEKEDLVNRTVPDLHSPITTEEMVDTLTNPRVFKTHFCYRVLEWGKAIFLYRDPRDVAISYFHFNKKLNKYSGTFNTWLRMFLNSYFPFFPMVNWRQHTESWLKGKERNINSILVVKYEDMVANIYDTVAEVCKFIGLQADKQVVVEAIKGSSFERINRIYSRSNRLTWVGIRGGPGQWKETLTDPQNDEFWKRWGNFMSQLGYKKERNS